MGFGTVWTLTSNGYKYYTLNLLESLKKIGVQWSLHVYCADRASYTFFKREGWSNIHMIEQPMPDAGAGVVKFGTERFQTLNRKKLDQLRKFALDETLDYCIYMDGDIAVYRDFLPDILGRAVRVQPVPCVGRCAQAPVAVVGKFPVEAASPESVLQAIRSGLRDCPALPLAPHGELRPIDRAEVLPPSPPGRFAVLQSLIDRSANPGEVIALMQASALRGMGGAGFPAGRKWQIVANFSGLRMLVVNADEGEPGTFKDRFWLEHHLARFLEGMLIAAWAVGCSRCFIYLRDEYAGIRISLQKELAALRAAPLRGWDLPDIELRRGAGAYICGEESALIESIEGKRGAPRLRPPYVAEVGLFGRPTLAHNVETLAWVPIILERGADWFAQHGRRGRTGLRSFSVSGRVRQPGVKIAPAGISARELIDEYCGGMAEGHTLKAYLPGGASGGILPASLADEPLDFDTLQSHGAFIGSAAVIVLSQHDDLKRVALNLMRFFKLESCGQCTPCRVGTAKAQTLLEASRWDIGLLGELSQTMIDASICGLGQAAPHPVLSLIRHFPRELA